MSDGDLIPLLLDKQHIEFETIHAPDAISLKEDWLQQTVPLESVCHVTMLQDDTGLVIALYPASHQFSLANLNSILHRNLGISDTAQIVTKLMAAIHLPDFELNTKNGIQVIIDEQLTNSDFVYFMASHSCTLLKVVSEEIQLLSKDALIGSIFSTPAQTEQTKPANKSELSIRERIAKIDRLPALPDMPSRILSIRNNPNSTVDDLVEIVEADLSLSSQIIRYSNSAIFNNREPITSLKDAIFRVLGYETVLHLSLGYAMGRVFKLPEKGPLGEEQFWKHSTYTAALTQQLATAMPRAIRPKPGIAYLAGLLHDVGFLALHLFFKNEHAWLNKMISANPEHPIHEMENRLLGTTHTEIGAWLMQAWDMPEELTITVKEHHNLDYDGPWAEYPLLLNLSERLLKMHGMSDADTDELPEELLAKLGLNEEDVFIIMDEVLQGGDILSEMAVSVRA